MTKNKKMTRWSRARGTATEWMILIAVAVALGIPLAKMVFGHLSKAGDNGGNKIEQAVNGN